jgi:outer membrane autotransporter protein
VFDQSFDGAYASIMSGTGTLAKEGTGKLSITGTQEYTGVTNINAGNLNVNGSLVSSSVVNVNTGGVLSGNGRFGNVNLNGGRVSPGNSIGTIIIDGNLNMGPGSEYHVEINGNRSDLIQVAGSANILSSTFSIGHDTDPTSAPVLPGKTYTILTTGGGLTGTSPTLGLADFPFLNFALGSDGFNAYLTTSRGSGAFAELATTRNEKAVANVLDSAGAGSPLWQQVVGASEAQARAAFTSLGAASFHANVAGVLSAQSHHLRDAVTDRLRQDFAYGTSLAPSSNALAYAPDARNTYAADRKGPFYKAPLSAALMPAQVYAVWAQALGSWGGLKGDGNAARTDHSLGGIISGLDVTFNGQWRVGLAGGYSQSIFKSPAIAASGSSDNYHVSLYGGGQVGAWGVRGGASYSWHDVATSRYVAAVNLAGNPRGNDAASTTQAFGEIGYGTAFGAVALEPFANIAYVQVSGGVNEVGIAAMTGSATLDTTYSTLGARGSMALTDTLRMRGTLGWRHALGDITSVAALAFQSGGATVSLLGSPIARNALVAEAGLDLAFAPNASLGISWTGQFGDRSHDSTAKGHFTWRF